VIIHTEDVNIHFEDVIIYSEDVIMYTPRKSSSTETRMSVIMIIHTDPTEDVIGVIYSQRT
jgi:hypothetical protein